MASVALLWIVLIAMWLGGKNGRDAQGDVLGPDFPAFYTGGWMLRNGENAQLYDSQRQREIQQTFLAGMRGVSAYINPPHFALLMQPLSRLPYPNAFGVWTCLSLCCFLAAVWLLRLVLPTLQAPAGVSLMFLALSFAPVYYAVSAGQNTGFTLLLHTAILLALMYKRDVAAGLLIALGLIKPQLFLPLLPLLLLARRPQAIVAFAVGSMLVIMLIWQTVGLDTMRHWVNTLLYPEYSQMAHVYAENIVSQSHKMVSWQAFWRLLLGNNAIASALGWLCAIAVFAALCRHWNQAARDEQESYLPLCYALAICAIIVMVPHVFLYDLGLLVLPGLIFLDRVLRAPIERHQALRIAMLLFFVGSVLIDQAEVTRLQILVPLLTIIMFLAARSFDAQGEAQTTASTI